MPRCPSRSASSRRIAALVPMLLAVFVATGVQGEETGERLRDSYLLTGRHVRRVFRDVVVRPRTWTAQILEDDKPIGLGAIVGSDGWILSKASQSRKATHTELSDGRRLPIRVVGYHQAHDLILFKVDAQRLPVAVWEQKEPDVGAWLVTVGSRQDPVAVGVMSVPRRTIPRSEVHGVMGIELAQEDLARIRRVFPNGGASAAGLREGDVVMMVDRRAITSGPELVQTLRGYRPGDTLMLRIRRDEEEFDSSVTLTYPFGDHPLFSRVAFQNEMGGALSFRRDDFAAVYQHDSVLDPEECGGPVVNLDGKAVGINIARAGRTESYILPADLLLSVLDDMKSGKLPPPSAAPVSEAGAVAK